MRLRPYGDRGVLVDLGSTDEALAWASAVGSAGLDGVEQVVPAARSVLVVGGDPARLRRELEHLDPRARDAHLGGAGTGEVVEVRVVYDGPDLADVARHTGLDPAEVVAAHAGQTWRVAFGGFAPGFGYLVGEDDRLQVPRRPEPRTRVPAGSVALAGEYSGVYPTASPGGWQLIGRTGAVLWDLERDPPALLAPGVSVRFVDAGRGA